MWFVRARIFERAHKYEYAGAGTYSGGEIANFAVAASSEELFTLGPTLRLLSAVEKPIHSAKQSSPVHLANWVLIRI